jgi:hypothetical protein
MLEMRRTRVPSVIRRTVLLHLSTLASVLLSCGGQMSPSPAAEGGASASGGACRVTSSSLSGGCGSSQFPFEGNPAECGADDAGLFPRERCAALCPPDPWDVGDASVSGCQIAYSGTGASAIQELDCRYGIICGTGRRPAGLQRCSPRRAPGTVAGFLARMAYLEAASVDAFRHLKRELEAHGAPRDLLVRASRARRDEVEHARVVQALAERVGAVVPSPRVHAGRVRRLEDIAIENAVEGCVHETFGAAVALVQAATAGDRLVRAAMRTIARDELRHADLSWAVAHWLEKRLGAPARARVRQARNDAGRDLVRTMSREPPRELVEELGIPAARHARAMAEDLRAALWS